MSSVTRLGDALTNRVAFYRKVKETASDGQPMSRDELICDCLASVEASAARETVIGDVVTSGTRYTLRVWRTAVTSQITTDCVAQLRDGTRIEIDTIVPGQLVIEIEGAARDDL